MDLTRPDFGAEARGSIPLIASSRLERFPRYAPDGKRIAFVSLRSGDWQLWIADERGANAVQMTSFEDSELMVGGWQIDNGWISSGD